MKRIALAMVLGLVAAPAAAEVVERHADGFTLHYSLGMENTPDDITSTMTHVGDWWDSAHTYSGDAHNITVDMRPGGCWCEQLATGEAFQHATVVAIEPDGLAFDAPFGPLHGKATRADLTVSWPAENQGWAVTWTMVIEGPGLGAYADGVDAVMGAGFNRFTHYLEYGEAGSSSEPSSGER